MKKVVKFGGSSLASAEQFIKVGNIIHADADRKFVVPSAPGKRFDKDTKVTDMLYACYSLAEKDHNFMAEMTKIEERYQEIIDGLGLDLDLSPEFSQIIDNFKQKAGSSYAASRGEYLNGIIMANYLGYEFVDPAEAIRFNEAGIFDAELTNKLLSKRLADVERAVIPGFYGVMPDGIVQTFSRGGSDITGSIVAKAIQADVYENWTDVSGIMVADPRIIHNPVGIEMITYAELRELSYMGFNVLHEDAIFPVRKAGIPINIKNTNKPEAEGTMIVQSTCRQAEYTITGIAGKKGFVAVNIEKDMMNSEVGFLRRILTVLDNEGLGFEHIPTGIDTMSIVVSTEELNSHPDTVRYISQITHANHIEVINNMALVAVVGRNMREKKGTATRIFAALSHADINIKMIDQGSSELNIIVGIDEKDFEKAIRVIYDMFMLSE